VTGGTRVLSDENQVRITSNPGETFLDRMIKLVEGAFASKNTERDCTEHLAGRSHDHLSAGGCDAPAVCRLFLARRRTSLSWSHPCLPHTHKRLGTAFRYRHCGHGPHDPTKTSLRCPVGPSKRPAMWTCCCWTRPERSRSGTAPRRNFFRHQGFEEAYLADAAQLSSLADETPEGRSIVVLAKERYKLRGRDLSSHSTTFIPFFSSNQNVRCDMTAAKFAKALWKQSALDQPPR